MRERRWLSWVVAVATSVGSFGCVDGGPLSGQIGGVHEGGCDDEGVEDQGVEDIGVDDVSPLGFSARQVLSVAAGERSAPLTWAKGGSTTATLSVGEIVAVRFGRPTEGRGVAGELGCAEHLEIDVPMAFSTEDGAFDESFEVTLRATQADAAWFLHAIDLSSSALQGSYEVTEVDTTEFRKVFLHLSGTLSSSAVEGQIEGIGEILRGTGPLAAVSARSFRVAQF